MNKVSFPPATNNLVRGMWDGYSSGFYLCSVSELQCDPFPLWAISFPSLTRGQGVDTGFNVLQDPLQIYTTTVFLRKKLRYNSHNIFTLLKCTLLFSHQVMSDSVTP